MTGRVSLVAHRGQPLSYPENSLEGFRFVLSQGANNIETDVNITADGIPVLSHDANLLKLTEKQIIISDHSYAEIKDMPAGFSERFGDQFDHFRIATLKQFSTLIRDWPDVRCLVEIKDPCLNYFGLKAVDLVMQELTEIQSQVAIISRDAEALVYARQEYDIRIGWVLPDCSEQSRHKAIELEVEYLFVSTRHCPPKNSKIWEGSWEWIVYTVNNAEEVAQYAGLGIELIETDRFSELKLESDIVEKSTDF